MIAIQNIVNTCFFNKRNKSSKLETSPLVYDSSSSYTNVQQTSKNGETNWKEEGR